MLDTRQSQAYDVYMDSVLMPESIYSIENTIHYICSDIMGYVRKTSYTIIFLSGNQLNYENDFRWFWSP